MTSAREYLKSIQQRLQNGNAATFIYLNRASQAFGQNLYTAGEFSNLLCRLGPPFSYPRYSKQDVLRKLNMAISTKSPELAEVRFNTGFFSSKKFSVLFPQSAILEYVDQIMKENNATEKAAEIRDVTCYKLLHILNPRLAESLGENNASA